ncbi:MAG: DUF4830 domain-containing protein [Oscillospiraceae bacterium]|jgi:hypothetical protein|nr:DUF4830 domain-containing protein [Oscillospiraceae bacterium]
MFIFTAKLTKKKLIAAAVAGGLLLCGLILLVSNLGGGRRDEAAVAPVTKGIKTNDDRLAYLSALGWKTSEKETEAQEVLIPEAFNDVMNVYNELQRAQGFDLLKYKGKRVMRYTYEISNHSGGPQPVYAELLVYKNQIIGGDIHNTAPDGFIQGLTARNACACPPDATACLPGCTCTTCQHDGDAVGSAGTDGSDGDEITAGEPGETDGEIPVGDGGPGLDDAFDEQTVYEDDTPSGGLPEEPTAAPIEPR